MRASTSTCCGVGLARLGLLVVGVLGGCAEDGLLPVLPEVKATCAVAPSAPLCSEDGWCWRWPAPAAWITSVAAAGPDEAWLAGYGGLIVHVRCADWQVVPADSHGALVRIVRLGPVDVWAFSYDGQVLRYDGARFRTVLPGRPYVYFSGVEWWRAWGGVAGSGPDDLWASYFDFNSHADPPVVGLLHFDGVSFTDRTGADAPPWMSSLVSFGPRDAWGVGKELLHYDGERWSPLGTAGLRQPMWLDGHRPDDVCVGDQRGNAADSPPNAIQCWNGSAFAPLAIPRPARFVYSMWPGEGERRFALVDDAMAVFRNGAWTPFYQPSPGDPLHGSSGDWIISDRVLRWNERGPDVLSGPLRLTGVTLDPHPWMGGPDDIWSRWSHWDGRRWKSDRAMAVEPAIGGLRGDDLWAVDRTIRHYDGNGWTEVPRPGKELLLAIHVARADDAWAAGLDGALLRWNGVEWRSVDSGTGRDLVSVWASGAGDVWVMARDGAVLRSGDGTTFASVIEPDARQLGYLHGNAIEYRLFGIAPDEVWAPWLSNDATTPVARLVHVHGTQATILETPQPMVFVDSIFGLRADDVWIGGNKLLHWDGHALAPAAEVPTSIRAIGGERRDDLWAVGRGGLILHFDGTGWTRQRSITSDDLLGLSIRDGVVTVVGGNGTLLEHKRR